MVSASLLREKESCHDNESVVLCPHFLLFLASLVSLLPHTVISREQGWSSGNSAHLSMCQGFDSSADPASVICGLSLLLVLFSAPRGFLSGYSCFPLSSKINISKFQYNPGMQGYSVRVLSFIYIHIRNYEIVHLKSYMYRLLTRP